MKHENGFRIDYNAFPQWQPFPETLASLMPTMSMDDAGPQLVARGFRESDVAALRSYLETHDLKAETSARTLPIAISFSKVVKKYDRIKRPVGKDLVFSFLYQRDKAEAEVRRAWAEGLIRTLDDQRVRVLHSYFSEIQGIGYWSPDDAEAGVAEPVGRHAASGLRTTCNGRSGRSDAMKSLRFTSRGRAMFLAIGALLGAPQFASAIQMSVYVSAPSQWGTGSAFYHGHTVLCVHRLTTFSMPAAASRCSAIIPRLCP